jgi:hypothetical protein
VKALLAAGADPGIASGPAGLPRNYMAPPVNVDAVQQARARRARAAAAGRTYDEQVAFERRNPPTGGRPPEASPADDDPAVQAGLVGGGGGALDGAGVCRPRRRRRIREGAARRRARVNQTTEYGWTPLLTAINNRNYALAQLLIDRGADVNMPNKGGWTPLYIATDNRNIEGGDYPVPKPDLDHLEIIRSLLRHGANPNARIRENTLTRTIFTMQWFFEDGATPFIRAAQSSDTELMKLLLEYKADPFLATGNGDTALTAAGGIGWVEGVTYERSPQENVEAIRMLLDLGLDPNGANSEGRDRVDGRRAQGTQRRGAAARRPRREARDYDRGSRDTDKLGSRPPRHTWQALDYAEGLVRVGVQSATAYPETAALIRRSDGARSARSARRTATSCRSVSFVVSMTIGERMTRPPAHRTCARGRLFPGVELCAATVPSAQRAQADHDDAHLHGHDGLSHAEQGPMKFATGGATEMMKATGVEFSSRPAAACRRLAYGPAAQFVITLSGARSSRSATVRRCRFEAGNINLIEDTTGKGHITHNIADRIVVTIPLEDQAVSHTATTR